ncbi:MAG: hypothetical protein LUG18_16270 [Candidatus Azobacteroides sp.]|nr:hypothetical protein [Candidatus Azobacteroides sp.]
MKFIILLFCILFSSLLYSQEPFTNHSPEENTSLKDTVFPFIMGTHHSLSFKKPNWYWFPLTWSAKCQDRDISGQLACGVRYFDIRVRFKKGNVISGHGLIDYHIDVLEQLSLLDSISTEEDPIYIRIMYESKPFRKNPSVEEMKTFMDELRETYNNLLFTECHIRNPYTLIGTYEEIPKKNQYPFYKNYGAKNIFQKIKGLKFPYPRHFAKKNNKNFPADTLTTEEQILIFDFINIDICP